MTYVNKKTRIFLDRGDIKLERKRSESRLKRYPSAIDVRAWCDIVEDRRQHILELVLKGYEKCTGKIIPLEAIMNAYKTLLMSQFDLLQRKAPKILGTYKVTAEGPVKVTTRLRGIQPGVQLAAGKTAGSITTRAQSASRVKTTIRNVHPSGNVTERKAEISTTPSVAPHPIPTAPTSTIPPVTPYSTPTPPTLQIPSVQQSTTPSATPYATPTPTAPTTIPIYAIPQVTTSEIPPIAQSMISSAVPMAPTIPSLQAYPTPTAPTPEIPSIPQSTMPPVTPYAIPPAPTSGIPSIPQSTMPPVTPYAIPPAPTSGIPQSTIPSVTAAYAITSAPISGVPQPMIPSETPYAIPSTPTSGIPSVPLSGIPSVPLSAIPSVPTSEIPSVILSKVASDKPYAVPTVPISEIPSVPISMIPSISPYSMTTATSSATVTESDASSFGMPDKEVLKKKEVNVISPLQETPEKIGISDVPRDMVTGDIRGVTKYALGDTRIAQQERPLTKTPVNEPLFIKESAYITTDVVPTGDPLVDFDRCRTQLQEQNLMITHLKNERNEFKSQLDHCLVELENAKSLSSMGTGLMSSSCDEEIDALEMEIVELRSGVLSPEQEADVIKKEVEILKRYCMKLKTVENENENLKVERDKLKAKVVVSGIEVESKENISDMEELNNKLNNLEAMAKERDWLANKVQRLEKELLQYQDLPEDVDVYRNRSKMLDSALEERDKMGKKVEQIKDLENELNELRKKAARVDELEEELLYYTKSERNAAIELSKTKSKCTCLERELQNVKMERDSMHKRIECMKRDIDNLKCKCKEGEILKLERDRMQISLNELSHIQVQHESLRLKCKCLEGAVLEKEMYKQKYDEILAMECQCEIMRAQVDAAREVTRERDALVKQVCDLESCICEQEEEIKELVTKVDTLTRNKDEVQNRMKDALSSMRAEVEKKDHLIAASEEKLSCVQAKLKSSIQGVSCETICLKTRIEELEKELKKSELENEELKSRLHGDYNEISLKEHKQGKGDVDSIANMKLELEAAQIENKKLQKIANNMVALTGDEHVKKMLKQSECAVKRVVEELGKQYKEWDYLKSNKRKEDGGDGSYKIKRLETKNVSESTSNEKLKEEMYEIQREKEKLEKLLQQIEKDKSTCGSQQQLISLRIDFAKLQDQLQREIKYRKELENKLNNK